MSQNKKYIILQKNFTVTIFKLLFWCRDAKVNLWSQVFQKYKTFLDFPFLDIYKCPIFTFPKYSWEKKHSKIARVL